MQNLAYFVVFGGGCCSGFWLVWLGLFFVWFVAIRPGEDEQ